MQILGIQQSDEEKIRVIIERMLAEVQDRIDIMETASIAKLYEIGVKYDSLHEAVPRG